MLPLPSGFACKVVHVLNCREVLYLQFCVTRITLSLLILAHKEPSAADFCRAFFHQFKHWIYFAVWFVIDWRICEVELIKKWILLRFQLLFTSWPSKKLPSRIWAPFWVVIVGRWVQTHLKYIFINIGVGCDQANCYHWAKENCYIVFGCITLFEMYYTRYVQSMIWEYWDCWGWKICSSNLPILIVLNVFVGPQGSSFENIAPQLMKLNSQNALAIRETKLWLLWTSLKFFTCSCERSMSLRNCLWILACEFG